MSSILTIFLFIIHYSQLSISITVANKLVSVIKHQPFSTSYHVDHQIPSPPVLLSTTTGTTLGYSNHKQHKRENEYIPSKLELSQDSQYQSLFAMIMPLRTKFKPFVFNINQSPLLLLMSSFDSN